jgi:AcrR family transcriptional regulator
MVMAPTRQERKDTIAAMRKKQILDAAFKVFSEKGFAAGTTAEIARMSGVAEGTIYNYFTSKRELFVAIIQNMIMDISLLDIIGRMRTGDVHDTFESILQNRLELISTEGATRIPIIISEIIRDDEMRELWCQKVLGPFLGQMSQMVRAMQSMGKFRQIEPDVVVRAIGGLIMGFAMLRLVEGEKSPLNRMPREKVAEQLARFILHGLLNPEKES